MIAFTSIWFKLDREEALKILKDIMPSHTSTVINYIDVVPPNETNNNLSVDYQLHFKGGAYHSTKELEKMVKLYGLAIKQDKEKVIIYKPRCWIINCLSRNFELIVASITFIGFYAEYLVL